jgi:Rrf2 family nitric oxide-sensitive transcriptional repressor
MRLNIFTDYSLRVLMYLALRNTHIVTRHEIAEAYDISDNHLMKVVNFLGRCGYIETVRGKGGGMRLASAPEQINIGQVIHSCESDIPFIICFNNSRDAARKCKLTGLCQLKEIFQEGSDAMYAVLNKYTLADILTDKPDQMMKKIGIRAAK